MLLRCLLPFALCLLPSGCGTGAASDSPESLARAVFEAIKGGNQAQFTALLRQVSDVKSACPTLDDASLGEVTTELATAQDQAIRSFNDCRAAVRLDGAVFERADRSPYDIVTYRWASCTGSLTYTFMRVWFKVGAAEGSMLVNGVAGLPSRWIFEGGVGLCDGPAP